MKWPRHQRVDPIEQDPKCYRDSLKNRSFEFGPFGSDGMFGPFRSDGMTTEVSATTQEQVSSYLHCKYGAGRFRGVVEDSRRGVLHLKPGKRA